MTLPPPCSVEGMLFTCGVTVGGDVTDPAGRVMLEQLLLIKLCERCTLNSPGSSFHARTSQSCSGCRSETASSSSSATMSTSVQTEPAVERSFGGVGRCKCSFWMAVAHDVLGVLVIMVGVFGGLVVHDVFIYGGAIIIFLSLIWWVFWYSGNIDVPPEELEDEVALIKTRNRGLGRAVRRVSDRLSTGIRNSFRKKSRPVQEEPPPGASGPSISDLEEEDQRTSRNV